MGVDLQLAGRRALVTGGSRGIGRDVHAVAVDTGDDASVRRLAAIADELLGGIDILVNCAAKPAGQAPPLSLPGVTTDAFWSDVNVKVLGYLRCAQAVAPGMAERGWGRIISVSGLAAFSTGSVIGSIRNVAVGALTKNLADELAGTGVNVTAVHPGLTRTEATPAVVAARAQAAGTDAAEVERRMARLSPTRTLIDASEVAAVITFLASPLSVAINGEAIGCGGGTPGIIRY